MNLPLPTVIAVVEPYNTWNTSLVRGIDRYASEHKCWRMEVIPQELFGDGPAPEGTVGIFARLTNKSVADFVLRLGLPTVNLSTADPSYGEVAQCTVDEREIGGLAAGHLIERGFKYFAYLGPPNRRDGYHDLVQRSFVEDIEKTSSGRVILCDPLQAADPNKLRQWMEDLPKPVGVLAWNALQARRITEACRQAGVSVPEDVAVICGEHDDLYCEYAHPTITSVRLDGWRIGYAASDMLRKIIDGKLTEKEPVRMAVSSLMVRESTNTLAVEDRVVADAVSYIRSSAMNGIRVDDVVKNAKISRRALEQRFQTCVGRSPGEEIRRVRLEQAQSLLISTELTLAEIATACGMSTPGVLLRSFTRAFGITPAKFRKDSRQQATQV